MSKTADIKHITEHLPLLALRGLSVFPNMLLNFDVERALSTGALDAAQNTNRRIFLLAQKEITKEMPSQRDLHKVGTICFIKQILKIPGGGMKVLVEGNCRARLISVHEERKYYTAEVEPIAEKPPARKTAKIEALMRRGIGLFETYTSISSGVSKDTVMGLFTVTDPGKMADFIIQHIYTKSENKQKILDTIDCVRRLEYTIDILTREIDIMTIERQIDSKLRAKLEGTHRDHVLREQLRIIQSELGDGYFGEEQEFQNYRKQICALGLDEEVEMKLFKEVDKLEKQQFGSSESSVIRNYLDTIIELPWNKQTRERIDVKRARRILDDDHYGLDKVKERIIEFLAVRQLSPHIKGAIICLIGPPGVGKTSVAISVAKALNRKLARLSLGGVHDEAEIRGHRKTYIGAMPGRIIAALRQAGSRNPLMLLDEIDKIGHDHRGDPASALLEALDPEQNKTFRDNYLEIPFDLSQVMFITTGNSTDTIPRPLLDRMEVIELSSYTDLEKLSIAKRHLVPKQRKKHGMSGRQLSFTDESLLEMISSYTKESGVRILEREVAAVCRKTAAKLAAGELTSVKLTPDVLDDFLGVRKYKPELVMHGYERGIANGLAWTATGGTVLEVEVNVLTGTGKLELTGNLGEIMKESAQAAVSYIRSRAERLNISPDFYQSHDIHIHFPEGAIPKDGPSAGITMCIAVISALTGAPCRMDVAMTGEITLRGRILRIGGLKEKTMAALRAGIKTVIIPLDNEPDLDEIDKTVRSELNFVTTDHIDNILDIVLDFQSAANDAAASAVPLIETDKRVSPLGDENTLGNAGGIIKH